MMTKNTEPENETIRPEMTLLDMVAQYPGTEQVIRSRDEQAGKCLLCTALFDSVEQVARDNGLDLDVLLEELRIAAFR